MRLAPLAILLATQAFGIASRAADLPTGGVVAAGSASITPGTNSLRIDQGSDRAVINWNSFDVGAGNTVQFVQPASSSAILNRVVAANPSQIHGQITANGRVFLANPNGIVVGPGGRIDASGIFLTTASIADADFLAGNLRFETPPPEAAIVVAGQLDARYVLNIHAGTTDFRDGSVLNAGSININNAPFTEVMELTVTGMKAVSRAYDGTTVAELSQGTLTGLVAGDTLNFSGQTGTFIDRNVGSAKPVTVSGIALTDGTGLASNYSVKNPTGLTADITPASLVINGTNGNKQYDGSLNSGTGPTATSVQAFSGDSFGSNLTVIGGTLTSITQSGGTISVSSGSGLAISGSTASIPFALPKPQRIPPLSGGITSLRSIAGISAASAMPLPQATLPLSAAPAAPPTPASARGTAPAVRPGNAGGLVDGAVTVRMSLVDMAPIALR